jgi:hypothetical protein
MTAQTPRGIEGAEQYCPYMPEIVAAQERFAEQQAADPNVGGDMIFDPARFVSKVQEGLKAQPCTFTQTGRCRVAELAIKIATNRGVDD